MTYSVYIARVAKALQYSVGHGYGSVAGPFSPVAAPPEL